MSIGSGVLPTSHSIVTGGLFPRTGSQIVQLQHSRAAVINEWSRSSIYLYALVVCKRISLRNSLYFYPLFPFFSSSFVSFFAFCLCFFFLHYSFIFFWTTQSVEWLDDSLNNQISEVRFPERRYKAQTILRVIESVLKAVALGVKLSIGKAVPSPAHTETARATDILKSPQPSWRGSVLWTTLYLSCIFVPSSFTINTFLP